MGKYNVGDYVKTKRGVRCITRIYSLNEIITVFEVIDVLGNKSEIFYGDIEYKVIDELIYQPKQRMFSTKHLVTNKTYDEK